MQPLPKNIRMEPDRGGSTRVTRQPTTSLLRHPVSFLRRVWNGLTKGMSYTLRTIQQSSWFINLSAGWGGAGYLELAQKTLSNPIGWRGMWTASQLLSSLPILAMQPDAEGKLIQLPSHPFLDLLKRPNMEEGWQTFAVWLCYDLYFGGEIFMYFPDTPVTGGPNTGKPGTAGIRLLRPHTITQIDYSEDGFTPSWYHWKPIDRRFKHEKIPAGRILHIKYPNPINPERGWPFAHAIQKPVEIMASGDEWNKTVADGKGKVPGYLQYDRPDTGVDLDQTVIDKMREDLSNEWSKAQQSSKPFLLPDGYKFSEAGQTSSDAEWLQTGIQKGREAAISLGFGPALIAGEHATYNNLQTDLRAAFLLTIIPMMEFILDEWNAKLMPKYGIDQAVLIVDTDDIQALAEDADLLHTRTRNNIMAGLLTINEGRAVIGEPASEEPEADILMVSFAAKPLSAVTMEADPFAKHRTPGLSQKSRHSLLVDLLTVPGGDGAPADPPMP